MQQITNLVSKITRCIFLLDGVKTSKQNANNRSLNQLEGC